MSFYTCRAVCMCVCACECVCMVGVVVVVSPSVFMFGVSPRSDQVRSSPFVENASVR